MCAYDRVPPDPAISRHAAQWSLPMDPSETQHSSQIDGDRHTTYHHLGASWNPRIATLFARPAGPHTAGQLHGRLVVEEKQPSTTASCRPQTDDLCHLRHSRKARPRLYPSDSSAMGSRSRHRTCRSTMSGARLHQGTPPPP
jgi:hypothetical protein